MTKFKGGDGGQLGIRSTIETLRTREFCRRVRIGVDRPEDREDIVDHVLSSFTEEESSLLNDVINQAVHKIEAALKELNKRNNPTEE
jgi:PTH1 family peptidyl-tRNA hydrolase